MKKSIAMGCVLAIILSLFASTGCNSAPEIDQIYDRVVELTEGSYALNTVFFGSGLPTLSRTSPVYQSLYEDYNLTQYTTSYDVVSTAAKFQSQDAIEEAAELIFSQDLCNSVLFVNAFEGRLLSGSGVATVTEARFTTDSIRFYQHTDLASTASQPLIFDYATMKIVRPSNSERVKLLIRAWEPETPGTVLEIRLTLAKNSDGVWLLDSLTV